MPQQLSENLHKIEEKLESAANEAAQTLKAMEQQGAERYAAARGKARERWAASKEDLVRLRQTAADCSQSAAKAIDTFARNRPWTTAGVAAGIGVLIGWLITRD